ncbi:hypothetical protein PMSD_09970 [Paenibacillus macquariensis subsp. defensor]|nr:hypothetical protein PMSD_09970 [Paenibacillus macquariensis subsp. defensor]
MNEQAKLKLSEIDDDIEIGRYDTNVRYTVAELKREIIELGESHHKNDDWHILIGQTWVPSAKRMIENYIENECDDMYEDWDERANDCITLEHQQRIQAVLDEAFSTGHATDYWTFDKPVEIDIKPNISTL